MTARAVSTSKQGKTVISGIEVEIDGDAIKTLAKDFWFLDDFTSEEPTSQFRAFTRLLKAALGSGYHDALVKLQGDDEILSVEKVSTFANEVFRRGDNLKN